MTYQYAAQFGPEQIAAQNLTTKLLVAPTSIAVYLAGTSTLATLFTDKTMATTSANPLATNVTENTPGIVTASGNVCFFVAAGSYDILINGTTRITRQLWPDPSDLAGLSTANVAAITAGYLAAVAAATTLS